MSISERHLSNRTYDTKNFYPLMLLSLNEVFRESMRKVQPGFDNVKIIVRCEHLPQIKGNRDDMDYLFEALIRMIIGHPASGERLFLYVDCEETAAEIIDDPFAKGFKGYTIKFRTNISPNENWADANMQTLAKCRQILSLHNAIFHVNSNNKGCLFSFSMPGKI